MEYMGKVKEYATFAFQLSLSVPLIACYLAITAWYFKRSSLKDSGETETKVHTSSTTDKDKETHNKTMEKVAAEDSDNSEGFVNVLSPKASTVVFDAVYDTNTPIFIAPSDQPDHLEDIDLLNKHLVYEEVVSTAVEAIDDNSDGEDGRVKKRARELMLAIHDFDRRNLSRGGDGCSQIHMVKPKGFRESFTVAATGFEETEK